MKTIKVILLFFLLTTLFLLQNVSFAANKEDRVKLASKLTKELKQQGWQWHAVTFKAHGNTIKLSLSNVTQEKRLTEGQLISALGSILTPNIVSRLKGAGFEKGEFIDGRQRSYSFEVSTRYYDKMESVYKTLSGGK